MKKLMTMIASVAMSFGLFAEEAYTIAFEAVDTAKGVDTEAGTFTTQSPWSPEEKVMTLVDSDAAAQNEAYGSDEKERRAFGSGDQTKNLKIAGEEVTLTAQSGDVFLDQLVKFTGFDEAPDFTTIDDVKVAVWMSEFEKDDETTETNLYVTCASVIDDANVTTNSFKIDGDFELDKWYRVTVRNIGRIGTTASTLTARAGFVVYINGELVSSADATEVYPFAEMTAKAKGYMDYGQLFPAISTADIAFNSVTFKGQGEVDDIIVDAEGPAFAQDVEFTLKAIDGIASFIVSNGTVEVAADDGTYTVKKGATVDIYAIPAEGKFVDPASVQKTVNASGEIDLDEDFDVADAEAKIKIGTTTTYYETFEAAFAAADAAAGDEPTLTVLAEEAETTYDNIVISGLKAEDEISMSVNDEIPNWAFSEVSLSGAVKDRSINAEAVTLSAALTIEDATMEATTVNVSDYAITLKGSGKVITTTELNVIPGDEGKVVKTDGPDEDEFYTYTLVDPAPAIEYVTFTVTTTPDAFSEISITTNGAPVVGDSGVYTVESNMPVTVTATLSDAFKNPVYKYDGADFTDTFDATKASAVVALTADAKVYLAVPTIDGTFTYTGLEQTALANGEGYTVVSGGTGKDVDNYTAVVALDTTKYDGWNIEGKPTANQSIGWAIDAAQLTATADDKTVTEGDPAPAYTVTVTGFVNGETAETAEDYVPPTATSTYDPATSKAGETITITAAAGDAKNYTFTYVQGTLTVNAKAAPVNPDEPQPSENPEADAKKFNDMTPAQKAEVIANPGIDSTLMADYAGKFEAVADTTAKTVTIQLKEEAKEALDAQAAADTKSIDLAEVATKAGKLTATVTPGFWYSVKANSAVDNLKVVSSTLATDDELELNIPHYENSGFYTIEATVKQQTIEE